MTDKVKFFIRFRGLKEIDNTTKHCCELMSHYLNEQKVSINYQPITRGYSIDSQYFEYAVQAIYYCPWCGTKLPPALNDIYFEILADEYQVYDLWDDEHVKRIPKEFYSDEWWKKRGL